jgi:hypothetical protein
LAGRESITFPTSISVDRGVIGFDGSTGKVWVKYLKIWWLEIHEKQLI